MANARGLIAVDKKAGKVLFLNPVTYETEVVLDNLEKNAHELLVLPETNRAYVPIYGDGIHGRNPNAGHALCVFDLTKRELLTVIDLQPLSSPHTLRLGRDGLIYMTCENSAKVAVVDPKTNKMIGAIDVGSNNCHRLAIAPDGQHLYTENEEDASISVIDLLKRELLSQIKTPRALAGIAVSENGRTIVAVDDTEPVLFLLDAQSRSLREELPLKGVPKAAQIARYAPDWSMLVVTSLSSNTVSLIDPSFREQTTIPVGSQPMDMAFHNNELFVACQGDGTVHVIDMSNRRHKLSFAAGIGCECLGFY